RDQRRLVELIAWSMKYEPDLAPYVTLDASGHFISRDDEFNPLADKLDMIPGVNSGNERALVSNSNKQAGPPQRGFLVTLLCRTPSQDPTRVVSELVGAELRKPQLQSNGEPVKSFSIERVTIPSKIKVNAAYPGGIVHAKRAPLEFTRPA